MKTSSSTLQRLFARRPPPVLFHYTSQAGLIGIVSEGKLWASKITHLNDSSELQLALEIARAAVEAKKLKKEVKESLLRDLELLGASTSNIFVFSLSENGDQLSQWRGYTPVGSGYAIGFSSGALLEAVSHSSAYSLGPCCYDRRTQESIVGEIISKATRGELKPRAGSPAPTGARARGYAPSQSEFADALQFAAPFLKHEKFAEEQEWRLVHRSAYSNKPKFKHRQGRSHLVPYLELAIRGIEGRLHPIRRVVIGPTPHPELARSGVESLMVSSGIFNFITETSAIPFRQW